MKFRENKLRQHYDDVSRQTRSVCVFLCPRLQQWPMRRVANASWMGCATLKCRMYRHRMRLALTVQLVMTSDKRGRSDVPQGEIESLAGKIDPRDMGSRLPQVKET